MLIIFGGLPSTGKTTIARELSKRLKAVYLRIDSIETAIKHSSLPIDEAIDAGYLAAYALAKDNLLIGHTVVADSVNSIPITRNDWRNVAVSIGKKFMEVEVVCSDKAEHKKRVETRISDIEGLTLPDWKKVQARDYQRWDIEGIRVDSAVNDVEQCVEEIMTFLSAQA